MDKEKIFFIGPDKKINPVLFSDLAEFWAEKICNAGLTVKKNMKTNKIEKKLEKNKISQIRKFYDEVLFFTDRIKAGEDYSIILPYIKMLNAKAAYAEGRNLITPEFKIFIKQCLDCLDDKDIKTLEIFQNFFEAFMGYYKYFESKYKTDKTIIEED